MLYKLNCFLVLFWKKSSYLSIRSFRNKWTIFIMILFIGGSLISGMLEVVYLGDTEASVLGGLWGGLETGQSESGITGFVSKAIGVISWGAALPGVLWSMVTFDYAMFEGTYQIVRYFFWAIGLAWLLSTATAFIRGVSSA